MVNRSPSRPDAAAAAAPPALRLLEHRPRPRRHPAPQPSWQTRIGRWLDRLIAG